jgi:hypothetical protein
MAEEQPKFKVVDRRPFNPDGTPRERPPEEEKVPAAGAPPPPVPQAKEAPAPATPETPAQPEREARPRPTAPRDQARPGRDPLDDPASFLSLIMSLASNAAASLGMMPHPATGETGVDLKTAKHWIDVLGMLENKTSGNLDEQEAQVLEGLLSDLRMQYVSFSSSPPPTKFSASDITGGK